VILLAGANGRLGRQVLKLLGSDKVVASVRRPMDDGLAANEIIVADYAAMRDIPWHRFRAVINTAGTTMGTKEDLAAANIDFAVNLAKAASAGGVRRFIQISSFSVYGFAERIGLECIEAPASDYGWSKARCDTLLQELATESFGVLSIRLPFMFSENEPALFHPLLKMLSRLAVLPTTRVGVQRSMITYTGAAQISAHFADRDDRGRVCGAGREPFDARMLARLMADEVGRTLRQIVVPDSVVKMLFAAAPTFSRRLLQSSVLAPSANAALDIPDLDGIEYALRALVRKYMSNTAQLV